MKSAKAPKKRKYPSGPHGRQLLLDEGEPGNFDKWSADAKRLGMTRAEWLRAAAQEKLERGKK